MTNYVSRPYSELLVIWLTQYVYTSLYMYIYTLVMYMYMHVEYMCYVQCTCIYMITNRV